MKTIAEHFLLAAVTTRVREFPRALCETDADLGDVVTMASRCSINCLLISWSSCHDNSISNGFVSALNVTADVQLFICIGAAPVSAPGDLGNGSLWLALHTSQNRPLLPADS
jgi:hypothetical protein